MRSKDILIAVKNETSRTFSIHGPSWNDTWITNRVVTAQLCGSKISCHYPGTMDRSAMAASAIGEGFNEVPDATRTDDLKGPWDVLGPDGSKVGRLENNMNFDLWFTDETSWASVDGFEVIDHGSSIGRLLPAQNGIVFHARE